MEKKDLPIGFFDSGIGGLSVLAHASKELPSENFIYYGDNKNAPYGTKSETEIQDLSLACGKFLYEKGVKAIVMACNTATSAAVLRMREFYRVPVISIEPAVKPAVLETSGNVLVMATPATLAQERYRLLVSRLNCLDRVINLPCPGLVELIETLDFESPVLTEYLAQKLTPLIGQNITGIVMGCTHYSFVSQKIADIAEGLFGSPVQIFDGMYGMTRQLKRVLAENNLLRDASPRTISYYSSSGEDTAKTFSTLVEK